MQKTKICIISYKSPLPLTDLRDSVPRVHCVVHRCRWSVW